MDLAIAAFAERQHGLISRTQLHAAGLDDGQITRRVQGGRLHRRYRGVYSLGPLSREGELLAAVLAAGPGALLSHWAAAELLEVARGRASLIDVIVPSKRRSPSGTRFRRATIDPRDRTDRRGIPVTMVHRLLVDLTDVVTVPDEITAVIRQAAYLGLYSLLATQDAMDRANGRNWASSKPPSRCTRPARREPAAAARSRRSSRSPRRASPGRSSTRSSSARRSTSTGRTAAS
ncbi:type IV toxin-antitoxin system AbiEi family antitoxin domain-containing protein [Solirubrobacter sp. CPCC 204708]|uniref:Type IV toxin-antitoxin system AbiEi family antitoxin domain-containing protein n=1 Tax=Solirubrobacter deserti TaxID=2282478 RepID=A0ABT4RT38_9ACTN|nr:type IV toxin-antitoxin system AbiEi family antitoxin domain-containing protein [Solirubrobacter deserti]MBE2320354.1 type IV toxin-antitoxin system AbiEi family antitoxin domain-containing protein [Solirubrobacter deserti]MDA0141706.1 type IV toxin-antitoxin system AbiEi family antitoxin domain-containing protein [Solirubrobacter deserti]